MTLNGVVAVIFVISAKSLPSRRTA